MYSTFDTDRIVRSVSLLCIVGFLQASLQCDFGQSTVIGLSDIETVCDAIYWEMSLLGSDKTHNRMNLRGNDHRH